MHFIILSGMLTIDDLKHVKSALWDARDKWDDIGLQLNVKKSDLDAIERKCRGDPSYCLTEMLAIWLSKDRSASWMHIISVLQLPSVGRHQLAEEIGKRDFSIPKLAISHDSSDTEEPYKCGCEPVACKSEFGCPNPILEFPQLSKLKDLDEEDKKLLVAELERDTRNIIKSFYELLLAFYKSLKERKVPVEQLVTNLMIIDAFEPVSRQLKSSPLIQEDRDILDNVANIEKVIKVIKLYSSFVNYEVLEHMIEHDGSQEDKQRLWKYKEDFSQYVKRRVIEGPSHTGVEKGKGHIKLIMKLDSKYEEYTIKAITDLRVTLSQNVFCITPETLFLYKIDDGCIMLCFQIPLFVYSAIFPLSTTQELKLQKYGVLHLTCGDYQFPKQKGKVCSTYVVLYCIFGIKLIFVSHHAYTMSCI